MHPTVKPTALVADAIRDCSPARRHRARTTSAGSGTTLIAAETCGRSSAADRIRSGLLRHHHLPLAAASPASARALLPEGTMFEDVEVERTASAAADGGECRLRCRPLSRGTADASQTGAGGENAVGRDLQTFPVGYKKPPVQHRFKKGCSGNPGGRPRKQGG